MMNEAVQELLEPEVRDVRVGGIHEAAALSIAISLRRIADVIVRPTSRLAEEAALVDDGAARRHHSVAEMAHECAAHHGVMILDVDREADGREYAHAIATWETDGGAIND